MLTSQNRRTVTLARARRARFFSAAMALICGACLILALTSGSSPALLIAPVLGTVLSSVRFRRWHRAIRTAMTSPDEYRWTP
jgi:hypothetical protein